MDHTAAPHRSFVPRFRKDRQEVDLERQGLGFDHRADFRYGNRLFGLPTEAHLIGRLLTMDSFGDCFFNISKGFHRDIVLRVNNHTIANDLNPAATTTTLW